MSIKKSSVMAIFMLYLSACLSRYHDNDLVKHPVFNREEVYAKCLDTSSDQLWEALYHCSRDNDLDKCEDEADWFWRIAVLECGRSPEKEPCFPNNECSNVQRSLNSEVQQW